METLRARSLFAFLALSLCCGVASGQPAGEGPAYRLIDGFAPFYDPERPTPNSWAMPFSHLDLAQAPWVDTEHLDRAVERFGRYCQHVAKRGYTAVFVGNLIHIASFDNVQGGPVYDEDSPYRERSRIYREAFTRCAEHARKAGLELVVETDLPAWSRELQSWLGGEVSVDDPRLWEAYRGAIEELFADVGVGALSVRIGEGGGAYDEPTGYRSGILVKTVSETQAAIDRLLKIVEAFNAEHETSRRILFRTWTIGIGEIGNLHTDPELYERVFKPFYGRPYLTTVIKHVAMDFFAHVPINRTIGVGELPQVVEFQARREYEGFGLFPNFRVAEFAKTVLLLRANKTFAGISVWTTNGGFLLPARNYYAVHGPDACIDANAYAYVRLLDDPTLRADNLARAWAVERGASPDVARQLAVVMARSQSLVDRGLYIGAYARSAPSLFGVDVFPTMLWVYWNRPSSGYAVQALLESYAREEMEATFLEGREALAGVEQSLAELEALPASPLRDELLASVRYQRSLFAVLAEYREVFLHHHRWAILGDEQAFQAWRQSLPRLAKAMAAHDGAYRGDPHRPAFDLRELRRELRDDHWIPRLRPLALILALLNVLMISTLVQSLFGRVREGWRQPPAPPLVAAGAALLGGLSAALMVVGHRGVAVGCFVGLGFVVGYLVIGGVLRKATPRPDAPVWGAALAPLAPSLLFLTLCVFVFALRGPAPLHHLYVSALLGGAGGTVLVGLAVGLGVLFLICLWIAGRRCGARPWFIPAVVAAVLLLKLGGVLVVGEHGILMANDVLRLGPTVLGEAGTGVEDLLD